MVDRSEFDRRGAERIEAVKHLLEPGESILDHGLAKLGQRIGFLVVTTRRLIHVDEDTDERTVIALNAIECAEYRNRIATATATIKTAEGRTLKINGGKVFVPNLVQFLTRDARTRSSGRQSPGSGTQGTTRDEIVEWCAEQHRRRAASLEMKELVVQCVEAEWPDQEIVWQFHSSQWGIVTMEARERFRLNDQDHRGLLFDPGAQVLAIEKALPDLLPGRASPQVVADVVGALRDTAAQEGWTDWHGPRAS